jgi:signal transduction histidine kinase
MKRILPILLLLISIGLFVTVIQSTSQKIDQPFPGYLTFENGVVGAFYVSEWSGPKQGLTYHQIAPENPTITSIFTLRDYVLICVLPAVSGLFFVLLGLSIFYYLPGVLGRYPLLWFHLLAGNYLILCPDFHIGHQFSYLLIMCFIFIPASVIHFALLFPEEQQFAKKNRWIYSLSYLLSFAIAIPYIGFFNQPMVWMKIEYIAFCYLIFSYFFWLVRLIRTIQKPQLEFNRIIARYILLGQIIAFAIPLIVGVSIFLGSFSFPLNLAAPFAMLFPISLFMGVILGRLRQSQMQLVQVEKSAALGNLLAGLAHEINNPMTFIYSAMEPLKESLNILKSSPSEEKSKTALADINQLIEVMEEGATRAKNIIESFRYFSSSAQMERKEADLHEIMDQSIRLLEPRWKGRIEFVKHYDKLPLFKCFVTEIGQVFINILANACYAIPKDGKIEITTHADISGVEISITDNGVGISKETLAKIFDPFYTTREQGQGSGLGLAITLEIIKKHGGTINVKSEPSQGTCFIIKLPYV